MAKTEYIVRSFAARNYGIVSGLALGIDSLAHGAALEQKAPTITVIPKSLNNIDAPENQFLADKIIADGGPIISEQASNLAQIVNSFVFRNRIIAVLSTYLIPVEMGRDSGTRHVVHYTMKFGKKRYVPRNAGGGD